MTTTALVLIGIVLGTMSGCSLRSSGLPAPTKEQIVLHGVVDFNESTISPDSAGLLKEAAARLNEHGNLGVIVEGHSDSAGSAEYNQKLSLQRAEAVQAYLVHAGVAAGRIVVIGKGAADPVASNATPEGRAENRRVVLVVYQP